MLLVDYQQRDDLSLQIFLFIIENRVPEMGKCAKLFYILTDARSI